MPPNTDIWLIQAVAIDLVPKLGKLHCRVTYDDCNSAFDNRPTITILGHGRRKPPYVPLAFIQVNLSDIVIWSQPVFGKPGLDGHPMWHGSWTSERHFEYANPALEDLILEHVQTIIHKHAASHK